jgi:RimJ/RimL family protein N-acetyltransferase
MNVELVPAEPRDFEALLAEPLPWRVKAFAGRVEGKTIGVGGLTHLPDGTVSAFVLLSEQARRYPIALHKAAMMTMNAAIELGFRRVIALPDPKIEAAERWLLRLGFHIQEIDGHKVAIWTR